MDKKPLGKISHYYPKIGVAIIELEDTLKVGDTIQIAGKGTEFEQTVESMQIDREPVEEAGEGQSIGLKTAEPVKPGSVVYKVE